MGLDIRFTRRKQNVCPKCGEVIGSLELESASSSGRKWYPILESLGYYVPYDQRNEDNDWYGKDMVLTKEQAMDVYKFVRKEDVYEGREVAWLIATAIFEDDSVVINADW